MVKICKMFIGLIISLVVSIPASSSYLPSDAELNEVNTLKRLVNEIALVEKFKGLRGTDRVTEIRVEQVTQNIPPHLIFPLSLDLDEAPRNELLEMCGDYPPALLRRVDLIFTGPENYTVNIDPKLKSQAPQTSSICDSANNNIELSWVANFESCLDPSKISPEKLEEAYTLAKTALKILSDNNNYPREVFIVAIQGLAGLVPNFEYREKQELTREEIETLCAYWSTTMKASEELHKKNDLCPFHTRFPTAAFWLKTIIHYGWRDPQYLLNINKFLCTFDDKRYTLPLWPWWRVLMNNFPNSTTAQTQPPCEKCPD